MKMEFKNLDEFDKEFMVTFYNDYSSAGMKSNPFDLRSYEANPRLPKEKAGKEKTTRDLVFAAVSYAVIGILAASILLFFVPTLFGVKLLNIESGSMKRVYPIGTLVWAFPTKYEKIDVGDDVTYALETGKPVTHRVIAMDKANMTLTVQGTDNSAFSEIIRYDQVVGVIRFHVKRIGPAMAKISGQDGYLITGMIILVIALLWGASFMYSKMKAMKSMNARQQNSTD